MSTSAIDKKRPSSPLWGIVLAGGDYNRLAPFIRKLRGDNLPKPFVNFIGKRSMLQHTLARAEKLIAHERLFTVFNRRHLEHSEARRQIRERAKRTVVLQPENKGSLAAVLLPLLHIYRRDPLATVALFPADQFILQEDRFITHLYLACRAVESNPSAMIALGIRPESPYGERSYILPEGEPEKLRGFGVRRVASFIVKPSVKELPGLLQRGALWNTMVIVFKAFALFDLTARFAPSMHAAFERLGEVIGAGRERRAVADLFRRIDPCDFSTTLLPAVAETRSDFLLTLPVEGVFWSDWAEPLQVVTALTKAGYLARANGLTERRLFALWSDHHRNVRKRRPKQTDSALRIG